MANAIEMSPVEYVMSLSEANKLAVLDALERELRPQRDRRLTSEESARLSAEAAAAMTPEYKAQLAQRMGRPDDETFSVEDVVEMINRGEFL